MKSEVVRRALNTELQDASRALAMAESDALIARLTGDARGYQDAKGRKAAARCRIRQCKTALFEADNGSAHTGKGSLQ